MQPVEPRPIPFPPPGRTAAPRPPRTNGAEASREPRPEPRQAMHPEQYIRLQALRVAVDRYRGRSDTTDEQLLDTARAFTDFIRTRPTPPERPDHDRTDDHA